MKPLEAVFWLGTAGVLYTMLIE